MHDISYILESDNFFLKVGFLLALLTGIVVLIYLAKYAIGHAVGFLHDMKYCRVKAQLHGGEQVFPGIVTRAGLDGVQFEFKDDVTGGRLKYLMDSPGFAYFDLWIDGRAWPVFVDGYHRFYSALYFLTRLERDELSFIFSHSTRAVENAPPIEHKSTRKKWRAEIKKRQASIQDAVRQRANAK